VIRLWAFLLVTLLLGLRLFSFSEAHTSQLPFMDQWDVLRGFFDNYSLWDAFRVQHGSHRQGLGNLLSYFLLGQSNMNFLWETRAMVLVLVFNTFLALYLTYKILGRLSWWDLLVPAFVLNLSQYEIFAGAPNPAHGVIPQTLILLLASSFFIPRLGWRMAALLVLSFLVMHTGYGYFAVYTIFFMLLWSFFRPGHGFLGLRRDDTFLLLGVLVILAIYYTPYAKPMNDAETQNVGLSYLWKLPFFAAGIVSRGLGASRVNFVIVPAFIMLLFVIWRGAEAWWKTWRSPATRAWLFVTAVSLLFLLAASWGRAPGGMGYSITSRYVPYVTLFLLSFYWYLRREIEWHPKLKHLLSLFLIFYTVQELRPRGRDMKVAREYFEMKERFIECYLLTQDFGHCNDDIYNIYPTEISSHIPGRLKLMDEKGYGFFRHRKGRDPSEIPPSEYR
jgi:hypothetical protein